MAALITPTDISTLARPCYADKEIANKAIDEAIDIDIRYLVGDTLFQKIMQSKDTILLNGGLYKSKKGEDRIIGGLKKAVAYLSYSRVVKFGNSLPTRFGTMNNNDAYSSHTELKERQMIADDTYSIGLKYVEEVLYYINDSEECCICEKPISKRSIFKIIGD